MKTPEVIYLMQRKRAGEPWETCWGCNGLLGNNQKEAKETAKRFTEDSVGIKFRAKKFVEAN